MHIKKVAKNIFFATRLVASVGYSCYKLLNNVAKVRSIYQKTAPRDGAAGRGDGKMKFFTQLVVPNPSDTHLLDGRC